jgi:hypothetical protein
MQLQLKIEELARFILAYLASLYIGYSWWVFLALLLVPDISMLGYLINTKIGAWVYNLGHHHAVAIAVLLVGFFIDSKECQLAGIIMAGHSSLDRILGYGLKYTDGFKHTHLGTIK